MDELTTTRTNELIDPTLHAWGWEVPVYLFLGGLVAGMMIITGYYFYKGRHKESSCVCLLLPLLGIILLSMGMIALFLDLEYKIHVWRMYAAFQVTSPMSWGSWILILVYPVLFGSMIINPPAFISVRVKFISKWSSSLNKNFKLIKITAVLNIVLGIMLGIYTGVLLSALGARPLWNSPMLSILFLVSGLSTAAAFVHMISKNPVEKVQLAKADNFMLTAELIIIGLFIIGLLSSAQAGINSVMLIINGRYAAVFWVFVIFLGMVIPLILQVMAVLHKIKHTAAAPLLVLSGGLILRFVIVYAGQLSHWTKMALMK
jgi:protein NrfD